MSNKKIKVLFIAGSGRSGSTILDNILGQIDGFFSVGEVHRLWDSGPIENRICGCGVMLLECPIWSKILASDGTSQTQDMMYMQQRGYRTRHLLRMLMPGGENWLNDQLKEQIDTLRKIYEGIQLTTNSQVIVDSSKFPSYAFALDTIPEIDLYLLHLVRDPRAVAYSWQRDKFDPGTGQSLGKMRPYKSSILWTIWNIISEILWRKSRRPGRYLRIHYEELTRNPEKFVGKITQFVDHKDATLPFVGLSEIKLQPTHSVCGNPVRFEQGITKIMPDVRWQKQIKFIDKIIVTGLTWPLLLRYKYLSTTK